MPLTPMVPQSERRAMERVRRLRRRAKSLRSAVGSHAETGRPTLAQVCYQAQRFIEALADSLILDDERGTPCDLL